MKVNIEISDHIIRDVLITALEGGSNYWYDLKIDEIPMEKNDSPRIDRMLDAIFNGVKVPVYDLENPHDEELGYIDIESMQKAIELMGEYHNENLSGIMEGNYDAEDADIFLQFTVMREIVFG